MDKEQKQLYIQKIGYKKIEVPKKWTSDKKFMEDYNLSKHTDNNFMFRFIKIIFEFFDLVCVFYKHYFTKKFKNTFYFPNEIWDKILLFNGIQKIMNYEEILKINIHVLMRSYLIFNNKNSLPFDMVNSLTLTSLIDSMKGDNSLCLILLNYHKHYNYHKQHYNFHKLKIYFKIKNFLDNYIKNNFDDLVEKNLLKNTLIYFHVKTYITFLSEYCSFVPLNININVFCDYKLASICYQQFMKGINQNNVYEPTPFEQLIKKRNKEILNQINSDDDIPDLEEININN